MRQETYCMSALSALIGVIVIIKFSLALLHINSVPQIVFIILIVLGAGMIVSSIFGFLGNSKENICMIWLFVIIMTILLVCSCHFNFVYLKIHENASNPKEELEKAFEVYTQSGKNVSEGDKMVEFQKKNQCCGINGINDYSGYTLPGSCFDRVGNKFDGCAMKLETTQVNEYKHLKLFTIGMIVIEACSICCGFLLALQIRSSQSKFIDVKH